MKLLENASNGNGNAFRMRVVGSDRFSLTRTFYAWGTFNGASVGLEISPDNGTTWVAVEDSSGAISLTSASAVNVTFRATDVRATVSGGGGSESISAMLY